MSDCRYGVSPVNYPDPDPDQNPLFLKIEILTLIKGQTSVEMFRKISCAGHNTAYTKFHQNPSICSQDFKWKQNSDINQGP